MSVFYFDAKTKLYNRVEGPELMDTAKGGWVVKSFDPARAEPYDTFTQVLPGEVSEESGGANCCAF